MFRCMRVKSGLRLNHICANGQGLTRTFALPGLISVSSLASPSHSNALMNPPVVLETPLHATHARSGMDVAIIALGHAPAPVGE